MESPSVPGRAWSPADRDRPGATGAGVRHCEREASWAPWAGGIPAGSSLPTSSVRSARRPAITGPGPHGVGVEPFAQQLDRPPTLPP